jgi:CRP-like cAMP-binding protein
MREAVVREYLPGELVCRQGASANCLYVLKSGSLRCTVLPERLLSDADEARLRSGTELVSYRQPDSLLGMEGALTGHAQFSLVAAEASTLVEIPVDTRSLMAMINDDPNVGIGLARALASRLKEANRRLSPQQRQASRFLRDFQGMAAEFYTLVHDLSEASSGQDEVIGAMTTAKQSWGCFQGETAGAEFTRANRALFRAALSGREQRELAADEYLCRKGDPGGDVILTAKGRLSVRVGAEVFGIVQAGEMLGELGALLNETEAKRPADIVAERDSLCGIVPAAEFEPLLSEHPRVLINLCRSLAQRVKAFEQLAAEPEDVLNALAQRLEGEQGRFEQDVNETRRRLELLLKDQELQLQTQVDALSDLKERWQTRMAELLKAR